MNDSFNVKRFQYRFIGKAKLRFCNGRKNTRSIYFQLFIFCYQAKFNRVPVQPGDCFYDMEQLPGFIKECALLTNNHKAQLANTEIVPRRDPAYTDERLEAIHTYFKGDRKIEILVAYCKELLEENKVAQAWQVLLSQEEIGVPA